MPLTPKVELSNTDRRLLSKLTSSIDDVAKSLKKKSGPNVFNQTLTGAKDGIDFHDEQTLAKVYDALFENGVDRPVAVDIVNSMQNRGVFFRERQPVPDAQTPTELHRDAGTGRFVTDEHAEENPGTTVTEGGS